MESKEEPEKEQRKTAIEELRRRKVGVLIQIIDDLADMSLSAPEIETILRTCGMNGDCAIRFGATMKSERDKDPSGSKGILHP